VPALEGFSPTPEFREIEQAQTLVAALAETDEVKNAAALRQRRLQLQTAYGRAVGSRGYSDEETKAAFARGMGLCSGPAGLKNLICHLNLLLAEVLPQPPY
jgi:hypothetical protein